MKSVISSIILLASLVFSGCATQIHSSTNRNPPPLEKFSNFTRFEMTKIAMLPPYAGQESNERALRKIQEHVSAKLDPKLAAWNEKGASVTPVRTLLIEPTVTEIKFISGGARFFAGAMAGSSAVILKVKYSEKETGKVIHEAELYAKADARMGGLSIGVTDNKMLLRIADRFLDYTLTNYEAAIGGATGGEIEY
jgi:hypothetical protein